MPRHQALVPFSHDHHEALLVALRLKKGGPSSPHDTLWPTETKQQVEALLRFADAELYPHFTLEEEVLFPKVVGLSDELGQIILSLINDHTNFRSELSAMKNTPEGDIPSVLHSFGESLDRHIRREERELFPMIETQISLGLLTLDAGEILERKNIDRN